MIARAKRALLVSAGILCSLLGIIGAFTPVMPSIPFFILASVCFSKSSKKFHDLLLHNRLIGSQIRKYHQRGGISLKEKIVLIAAHWLGFGLTAWFVIRQPLGRAMLCILGIGLTSYILSLKTVSETKSVEKG